MTRSAIVVGMALVLAAPGAGLSADSAEVELEQTWSHVRVLIGAPIAEDGSENGDKAADLSRIVETRRADGTVVVHLNGVGLERLALGVAADGRPTAICAGALASVRDFRFPSQNGRSPRHAAR